MPAARAPFGSGNPVSSNWWVITQMVNGAFSIELLDGVMDGVFEGVDMGEGSVCEIVSRGPAPHW